MENITELTASELEAIEGGWWADWFHFPLLDKLPMW